IHIPKNLKISYQLQQGRSQPVANQLSGNIPLLEPTQRENTHRGPERHHVKTFAGPTFSPAPPCRPFQLEGGKGSWARRPVLISAGASEGNRRGGGGEPCLSRRRYPSYDTRSCFHFPN
ncbi:hypothetical protein E2320_019474, partial [Naja naja]